MEELTLFYDRRCIQHNQGPHHPEQPARLSALLDLFEPTLPSPQIHRATPTQLKAIHAPDYVDMLLQTSGTPTVFDADTQTNEHSILAAQLAAGASCQAVDAIFNGDTKRAFVLGRPPGHHAEANRAMGFCFFNNIAIAAQHAMSVHDVQRVAIIDWDVHHGNGTQHSFESNPNVLVFNTHQWPLYPGTGAITERGVGNIYNAPLPHGTTAHDILAIYEQVLWPALQKHQPELILVSAGFDGHQDDPLGGFALTTDGFAKLTTRIKTMADNLCQGRLMCCLEGGYNITALQQSVQACIHALLHPTTTRPTHLHTSKHVQNIITRLNA